MDILLGGGLLPPLFQPLDEANDVFQVVQESVRNFDMVSYYNRRNSNVSPVFVAGED